MKLGFNPLLWTPHVTEVDHPHRVHIYISENNRGTPAKRHVPLQLTYNALHVLGQRNIRDGWAKTG